MKPRLHSRPAFYAFVVILAAVIRFPCIYCQENRPYNVCGQMVQCGYIDLEYPFWGVGRPSYCGHPGFQLTCQSNVPELLYESINYRVLAIDTSEQTINIARNDLWVNNCPQYLYNTTYNPALFTVDNLNQENVSLYYGCNTSVLVTTQPLGNSSKFSCTVNGTSSDGYFLAPNSVPAVFDLLGQCNNHIDVPVSQSSANQLLINATVDNLNSALRDGFHLQWAVNIKNDCDECNRSNGRCGSDSMSPELFICYCANGNFSRTCDNMWFNRENKEAVLNWKLKLVIGFSSATAGIMLIFFMIYGCKKKRSREVSKAANHQIEIFIRNYGNLALKRFKYSEIKKMTNSFQEKLGQGGYGSVYKGYLPGGQLVAVKLLSEATGDGNDFINEVASISRTSHVNIVTLLGFCIEGKKRALMYEFMPNGSLDKFLRSDSSPLDWNTLFLIAKGIARGLEYLHRGCNTRIVHFDIKPHNVLLDEEFVPKISDFGLAKLCKRKESIVSVTGARGTAGYMAPELFVKSFGGASHKSDVYSYGMMVLEMTGARKNKNTANLTSASEAYFPESIYKQVEAGDSLGVDRVTTEEEEELARKLVTVSLWCIQSDPSDRPSISRVVEMLEGNSESLQVPPKRFWSSPASQAQGTFPSATESLSNDRVSAMH
ncbi:leaf rust 10 disease-resistance locus receptor-like protein kinase-like 2.4 protein [Tanacetum coccineum]